MWTIFKVFIGFVTILRLFYVLAFDHEAYGILVPQPGVTAAPPVLEGNALSTWPPRKPLYYNLTEII